MNLISKFLEKKGILISDRKKLIKIFESSVQTKSWRSKHNSYANLCKNLGLDNSKETINYMIHINDIVNKNSDLYKHSIPLLKNLRKNGYKTGIISNSSIFCIQELKKKFNLLDYFDYKMFSFHAGEIKPSLVPYKKMMKKAKVKPKEMVMTGDNYSDDVEPARSLGINAIHFKNSSQFKTELRILGVKI